MRADYQMKELRIGIAGLGGVAKRIHLPVLKLIKGYKVVCGSEKDAYQLKRISGLFNLKETYKDFQEMIERADIDAVFICLPSTLHSQAVKLALKRGLHVFCEKPMGTDFVQAKEMLDIAEQTQRLLMPGYNLRHVNNFVSAKKIIDDGKLGKILQINATYIAPGPYISWDPKTDWYLEECSKGALYDLGCHIVDLLFYLFPHRIISVSAVSSQGFGSYDVITNINCAYQCEDGLLGTINVGWRSASEISSIEFHGTAGTLIVSRRNVLYTHGATDPADRIINALNNAYLEFVSVLRKIQRITNGVDVLEEFVRQADTFRNLIVNGNFDQERARQAVYVHEVLESIWNSAKSRKIVLLGTQCDIDKADK